MQVILIEGTIEIPGAGKRVDQHIDDAMACVVDAMEDRGWKFAGVLRPVDSLEDDPDICVTTETKTPTITGVHNSAGHVEGAE